MSTVLSAPHDATVAPSGENLMELTDYQGYNDAFLNLFGFGAEGVDYDADISPLVAEEFLA